MNVPDQDDDGDLARYVSLLFFGLMNVSHESDALLIRRRLWRNHHRVLDALSRSVARSLSELAVRTGTSKQALHKSIQGLLRAKLVQVEVDPLHRRAKSVKITPAGRRFEATLDECQQGVFAHVAKDVGRERMEIWADVMERLMNAPSGPPKNARAGGGRDRTTPAIALNSNEETPAQMD